MPILLWSTRVLLKFCPGLSGSTQVNSILLNSTHFYSILFNLIQFYSIPFDASQYHWFPMKSYALLLIFNRPHHKVFMALKLVMGIGHLLRHAASTSARIFDPVSSTVFHCASNTIRTEQTRAKPKPRATLSCKNPQSPWRIIFRESPVENMFNAQARRALKIVTGSQRRKRKTRPGGGGKL